MWDCEAITVAAGAPSRPGTRGVSRLPALSRLSRTGAILDCRYPGTCLLYSNGCQTAEATEEAGIDDSGPTLLGGGHHQKEADFARVRSEVTEGVPPRSQLAATSSGTEAEVDIRSAAFLVGNARHGKVQSCQGSTAV